MPPNDQILRNRKPIQEYTEQQSKNNNEQHALQETKNKQQAPSLKPNEIIIDGVVYDISNFNHPGGESIKIFSQNDVTVHYKMIHPWHTEKHLEKLKRVGSVNKHWRQKNSEEYAFDSSFERELKREVFKIVPPGQEFGTTGFLTRALVYVAVFAGLLVWWMMRTSYELAVVYGVSMALIGLNVQHDANHGAASRKVWVNDLLGLGADMVGGCKWLWMTKHWTHHAYTNHKSKDPDGFSAEPVVILHNYDAQSDRRSAYHSYQSIYLIFVLSGYWLSSAFNIPEVWRLQDSGAADVGVKLDENAWINKKAKYAVTIRLIYLFCNVVLPLWLNPSWTTFYHIQTMGVVGSLALGLLFTLSHNFENADRDPTLQSHLTSQPVCWYKAQVETSCTYGGTISGWLTGGLNFQIEHHLFPRMCSAWYPIIAPTVRRVCKKHGVRYTYYPWLIQNMISTVKYTHKVGTGTLLSDHLKDNPFKGET